jgi:hypothetical protein
VSDALARALAKAPDRRFATMEEFATALWPERPVSAGPPGVPVTGSAPAAGPVDHAAVVEPTVISGSTFSRRRMGGIAAALAVAIAAGVYSISRRQAPPEPPATPDSIESAARQTSPPTPALAPDTVAPTTAVRDSGPPAATPPAATPTDSAAGRPPPTPPAAREKRPPPPKRPRAAERTPDTAGTRPEAAPAPTLGYLTINAVPYGTVAIDGVEVGDTPLVRFGVAPGPHTFTVTREGYRTDTVRVTVTAGNEIRMSRTLTRATP